MGISFHCESCKKKIMAPDDKGGKWGSCPHCSHRCYIPLPASVIEAEEELKLAPVDANEETRYESMMRETHNLTRAILHETSQPDNGSEAEASSGPVTEKELIKNIIIYLREMADGELERAEETAARITLFKDHAKSILKKMAKAERPEPELSDIAPKVLQGLIKALHAQL